MPLLLAVKSVFDTDTAPPVIADLAFKDSPAAAFLNPVCLNWPPREAVADSRVNWLVLACAAVCDTPDPRAIPRAPKIACWLERIEVMLSSLERL